MECSQVRINLPVTDFRCLLYIGGAACSKRTVNNLMEEGGLGVPRFDREPLINLLRSLFEKRLITHKFMTVWHQMYSVRRFYAACDELNIDLTLSNVLLNYEDYIKRCWMMARSGRGTLSCRAIFMADLALRSVLQGALDLPEGVLKSAYSRAETSYRNDMMLDK